MEAKEVGISEFQFYSVLHSEATVPDPFLMFLWKRKTTPGFATRKRANNLKIDSFNVVAKWEESQVSPVRAFRISAKRKHVD